MEWFFMRHNSRNSYKGINVTQFKNQSKQR